MTTGPRASSSDKHNSARPVVLVAVVLSMAWGLGWIWVADSGAQQLYLWIGAPLIALMWMFIGWSSTRGPRGT